MAAHSQHNEPNIVWGQSKAADFDRKQMKFPAPDFVVEVISPGTEAIDRGIKFDNYAAHSVLEYWIVDPDTETVEQYVLQDGRYELKIKAQTGTITSAAVGDFTIPVRAILTRTRTWRPCERCSRPDAGGPPMPSAFGYCFCNLSLASTTSGVSSVTSRSSCLTA